MPKSTARFIPYDVRPAKQTERRGIIEFLNSARNSGYNIPTYRYVGFGGTKFIDFQLMERYVGFDSYVSIEHDDDIFERCKFNRPFRNIQMFNGALSTFLSTDQFKGNSVYWLDFEIGLKASLLADLNAVASRAKDGDVLMVTIKADLPAGNGTPKHLLKSRLPSLSTHIERLKPKQFVAEHFPDTVGILMLSLLRGAFASRVAEGKFHSFFKVVYKDSTWMCTVGGVFSALHSRRIGRMKRSVRKALSVMCPPSEKQFYRVPLFNFTELERQLLERSIISENKGYVRRLLSLGLEREELEAYSEISRFVPKYIESAF